jgi:hypothetical protein
LLLALLVVKVKAQQIDSTSQISVPDTSTNLQISVESSDTLSQTVRHSPRKASLYSTMLPGLGQAYNCKYWKIPIVYGLGAYTVYAAMANNTIYRGYRDAYRLRTDGDPTTIDEYQGLETDFTLQQRREEFRRDRDYFWILTGVVYVLNIVDAAVDAHLFYFDVSDKLSMQFLPPTTGFNPYTGRLETTYVSIKLKL